MPARDATLVFDFMPSIGVEIGVMRYGRLDVLLGRKVEMWQVLYVRIETGDYA